MAQTTVVVQKVGLPPYSKETALFGSVAMACFAGVHGFHRCYLGDPGLGCLQCITCGGCWLWSIIDWINIEELTAEACRRAGYSPQATTTMTYTTTTVSPTPQPYVQQPYPQQTYPQQPYPQQPYPGQPYPGQPMQAQPYPQQPYQSPPPY